MTSSYFQKGFSMSVKQRYLKDENGEVFSPIANANSIYFDTNNDIQPKFCLATFDGDKRINEDVAWKGQVIPMEYLLYNVGNGFSLKNGRVYIGSGIRYIKACGALGTWNSPNTNEITFTISHKRGDSNIKTFASDSTKEVGLIGMTIPDCIFEVQEGDYIEFVFSAGTTGDYNFIGRGTNTYLYIEKIC